MEAQLQPAEAPGSAGGTHGILSSTGKLEPTLARVGDYGQLQRLTHNTVRCGKACLKALCSSVIDHNRSLVLWKHML
jgi:hypothetical protein